MTKDELIMKQKEIDILVEKTAIQAGLTNDELEPIYDGIADEEKYLVSSLKVAWVLKEPYDDYNSCGQPCGGGWSLTKDAFYYKDNWKNPVWQKIAYIMYGFNHNILWEDMDWMHDKPEMIYEIRNIAWININKMPAYTSSNDANIAFLYNNYWREIVLMQLECCNPDVIIFANTFHCFANDEKDNIYKNSIEDEVITKKLKELSGYYMPYRKLQKKRLIDAYHPGRKGGAYVNGLIEALKIAKKELGK